MRPTLEYAAQVWDPHQKNQIKQIEKVQNKALRFIFKIKGQISFTNLRDKTGLHSLKQRREESRLKLFVKCLGEGIEPSFQYDLDKKHNTRQRTNTYMPHIRTNAFYHSFWPRTLRDVRRDT